MTIVSRRITNVNPNDVTTPAAPGGSSLGTSSSLVVAYNPARTGLIIVNLSTSNVYLAFGFTALANNGLTLLPQMAWKMTAFDFNVEEVNGIADSPGSLIAVQEFSL